jgi:hypothetical protein
MIWPIFILILIITFYIIFLCKKKPQKLLNISSICDTKYTELLNEKTEELVSCGLNIAKLKEEIYYTLGENATLLSDFTNFNNPSPFTLKPSSAFSFSLWFKTGVAFENRAIISNSPDLRNGQPFVLEINTNMPNLLTYKIKINSENFKIITNNKYITNKWVFFGMSFDFNTGKSTIVNNSDFLSTAYSFLSNPPIFNNINVGRNTESSSKVFPGEIRIICFYYRFLSNDHFSLIYQKQKDYEIPQE